MCAAVGSIHSTSLAAIHGLKSGPQSQSIDLSHGGQLPDEVLIAAQVCAVLAVDQEERAAARRAEEHRVGERLLRLGAGAEAWARAAAGSA